MRLKIITSAVLLACTSLACAAQSAVSADQNDPYQNFNRHAYKLNDTLDKLVFKPVATVYKTLLPAPAFRAATRFFSNLDEPITVSNELLQGKFYLAVTDTWRFVFNSTIGVLGLFDVASHMGLPKHHQDFGLTLAYWGVKSSPYLVIPVLGPSTLRDAIGIVPDYYTSACPYIDDVALRNTLAFTYRVNTRATYLNFDRTFKIAFDPYVFQRNAYLQRRAYLQNQNANGNETIVDSADIEVAAPNQAAG